MLMQAGSLYVAPEYEAIRPSLPIHKNPFLDDLSKRSSLQPCLCCHQWLGISVRRYRLCRYRYERKYSGRTPPVGNMSLSIACQTNEVCLVLLVICCYLYHYSFSFTLYFNRMMSLQRVVGFLLLKSCLMAFAKTLAFPLPSF